MTQPTHSPVTVRSEPRVIPTYATLPPEPNPMFYETRNVQGSRGNIYPHPMIDQISSQKTDRTYQSVILENEYLYLVLLPELGGRIFIGQDKTNGYDFFCRHTVIKPALIGTFGPWISGGVEFNWPQHHRPSTFDPTDFVVEENKDGSKTVWMGEHEPLNRTKAMVGVTLYPGKAYIETKVRLFNRTPFPQTFLWWANAGVPIDASYQVIFPPDVHHAVFHSKNPVTAFPVATGPFAGGNEYGDGTDISYWVNSPGATSFFAAESKYEFFGGYDHNKRCGVVHVADAGISGGKKYFTWGSGPFGQQWQKNLYDPGESGEYLELMAGVFTDNQPDFSWMMPYETRTFSQFWLPVQQIGPMKNANTSAALNLEIYDQRAMIGVYATEAFEQARITLTSQSSQVLLNQTVDLAPGKAFLTELDLPVGLDPQTLWLRVCKANGAELIAYQPEAPWDGHLPEDYQPPAAPAEIATVEELFLTGLHLEQYRHPGIAPELYWQEALRRDPLDARTNLFMGKLHLSRADFSQAENHLRRAIQRLTARNFNPYDGEAHYTLGWVLQYQGRLAEAYQAYYKATWNYAWQSASFYGLAQIDVAHGEFAKALDHLERSLQVNTLNNKARALKAAVLRHSGCLEEAGQVAAAAIQSDSLDFWARFELALSQPTQRERLLTEMRLLMRDESQTYLDVALEYAAVGLADEAAQLLEIAAGFANPHPMVLYTLSFLAHHQGDSSRAQFWQRAAAQASPMYCFPWRIEEMIILRQILENAPADARAAYYLGNLLYDKKQFTEAAALWQKAGDLEPTFSIPWRNLGLAAFNREQDLDLALSYYEKALAANPEDPRLFLEQDNLLRRKGMPPAERLARYEARAALVQKRDDLVMEWMMLYNRNGQPQKALDLALSRNFHPWEGGEGMVAGQYATACRLLGRGQLEAGNPEAALNHFNAGLTLPTHLGELAPDADIVQLQFYSAMAYETLNQPALAKAAFEQVLANKSDDLLVHYYQGLALIHQGEGIAGRGKLLELKKQATQLAEFGVTPNYFYYGNPNPTFAEDPTKARHNHHLLMVGLACLGLGDKNGARSALGQVLATDPANQLASEELIRIN